MAPLELNEKVFVDIDFLKDDPHGEIGCTSCHGGDASNPDWKTAHKAVVRDPSFEKPDSACGNCHEEIAKAAPKSLHYTLAPYWHVLRARMDTTNQTTMNKVSEAFSNHCSSCHSSCGQCHISRPNSVEGGFVNGHFFKKRPDMEANCTACHGSRIQHEYMGKNQGFPADLHYTKLNMNCNKCHFAKEMHSAEGHATSRYLTDTHQKCENCHKDAVLNKSSKMHNTHLKKVQCQVCHSVAYKNCYGCHVGKDQQGLPFFQVDKTDMDFKIGKNVLQSKDRPYDFVLVRHVPVTPNMFDYYVKNAFPNFNRLPTFKYATPHNIQRKTPQTGSCNNCHGNKKVFLTKDDVLPDELEANVKVIVRDDEIPPKQ